METMRETLREKLGAGPLAREKDLLVLAGVKLLVEDAEWWANQVPSEHCSAAIIAQYTDDCRQILAKIATMVVPPPGDGD